MFFLSFVLPFLIQSKQETSVLCAGHWQTQSSCSRFEHDRPSQPRLTAHTEAPVCGEVASAASDPCPAGTALPTADTQA